MPDIQTLADRFGRDRSGLIPILLEIQEQAGYLPREILKQIPEYTDSTAADVAGAAGFYSHFRHRPVGENMIRVCTGTACHVKGAELVVESLIRSLEIPDGDDTDPQRQFTVQKVACLGCCTLAPVVQIESVTYGHITPDSVPDMLTDFLNRGEDVHSGPEWISMDSAAPVSEIRVGLGYCCIAGGSADVKDTLMNELAHVSEPVRVKRVGCVGMCHQTPLLEIRKPDAEPVLYSKVDPDLVSGIIRRHYERDSYWKRFALRFDQWLDQLLFHPADDRMKDHALDADAPEPRAFLGKQVRLATEFSGELDPLDLDEYLALGGFQALRRCLTELSPTDIVTIIRESGLRGRGGAGFPTWRKWEILQKTDRAQKYIICNGDEGDPGAFMDRMLMESFPFRILEGILIAASAIGADQGFLYIRAEYPLAVRRMQSAIDQCRDRGLLGTDILKSGKTINLEIVRGAGAFVCGEETALIASISGERGMPRIRPPYPAERGFQNQPTLVNNVETYALVAWIMSNGAESFGSYGSDGSKGTKVFSLAGKVVRGGLIEVPMGITIQEVVEDIGGGVAEGRKFKAVQIGGPSGGCIPAELSDLKIDYEELQSVGAMMGSGGLLVMDDRDCMVDIARYFLSFTQDQSCGKCTHCRIGTKRMLEILERICRGKGRSSDLEKLETLGKAVQEGSLCGLGRTAPNPVLTTLKYFREEYEAHLNGHCPAGKCRDLISYRITDNCIGCTICAQKCPVDAIEYRPYQIHEINDELCTRCDICRQECPEQAVEIVS